MTTRNALTQAHIAIKPNTQIHNPVTADRLKPTFEKANQHQLDCSMTVESIMHFIASSKGETAARQPTNGEPHAGPEDHCGEQKGEEHPECSADGQAQAAHSEQASGQHRLQHKFALKHETSGTFRAGGLLHRTIRRVLAGMLKRLTV